MKKYYAIIKNRWGKSEKIESDNLSDLKDQIKGRRLKFAFIERTDGDFFPCKANKLAETLFYRPRY